MSTIRQWKVGLKIPHQNTKVYDIMSQWLLLKSHYPKIKSFSKVRPGWMIMYRKSGQKDSENLGFKPGKYGIWNKDGRSFENSYLEVNKAKVKQVKNKISPVEKKITNFDHIINFPECDYTKLSFSVFVALNHLETLTTHTMHT